MLPMEHAKGRKFKEKKKQNVSWYACEPPLGKERYVSLNGWKTRRSVC